ncbi:hypothetical protein N7540_008067 [Penicillium herquei]|nr:hypothetical protein N7540_008067 [Penicillium herquei]
MPTLDHSHWEGLYYACSPSPSQRQQAWNHETQSLMPVPMAPMQNNTLNNLYYAPPARPTLCVEYKDHPAIQLEPENTSFSPFDPAIQLESTHIDRMGIPREPSDLIHTAGAFLDYEFLTRGPSASQSRHPGDHTTQVLSNRRDETRMNGESKPLFSASLPSGEVHIHPNITQYVSLG